MISQKLIIPFLAIGSAAILNSCIEDNSSDETFSLNVQGYIVGHTVVEVEESADDTETTVTEEGETTEGTTKKTKDVYTYKPYFAISSSSVNYPIMSMNVYSTNGTVAMDSCSLYVYTSNIEKNASRASQRLTALTPPLPRLPRLTALTASALPQAS